MTFAIIAGVVVLIALYVLSFYNGTITMRNQVEEAFSTMDVYLKQRYDLIPNFVNTVKGYAAHEQQTLVQLTEARTRAMGATTTEEKIEGEKVFQSALSRLMAVVENYPELKANQNFLQLQEELAAQEGHIANSRKYYNANVREFNIRIEKFPGSLLAGLFGFTRQPLYEIPDVAQRENVTVQF
ncbi:MAG: LemA family protein [Clostridiales bacterium]|nr:LemA family protein [Clostridiales bacterium]